MAPLNQLLPLDFSEAFVLKMSRNNNELLVQGVEQAYEGDETSFVTESLVLTEEMIDQYFDYEMSSPENIYRIAFAIMTSFPKSLSYMLAEMNFAHVEAGKNTRNVVDSNRLTEYITVDLITKM